MGSDFSSNKPSSRGHRQKTAFGEITFPFTIRNQYTSSITTVRAAVENKAMLREYQHDFFKSALTNAAKSKIRGYSFGDSNDKNRTKAFIDKLLLHKIDVYKSGNKFVVPTNSPNIEWYRACSRPIEKYRDSVYYDASAWSVSNFYNMKHRPITSLNLGEKVTSTENLINVSPVQKSNYAYVIDYDDYNAVATAQLFTGAQNRCFLGVQTVYFEY